MTMKRFASVVVVLAILLATAPVLAADAWYTCNIDDVAVIAPITSYPDGAYAFQFTDISGTITGQWFFVTHADTKKGIMSVCLTAISTDRRVVIYADTSTASLKQVHVAPCDYADPCE